MKMKFSGRKFHIWQYRVSHAELLIRSPMDAIHSRNVDVMFAGVEYVELPSFLPDLQIDEPQEEDLRRLEERLGRPFATESAVVLLRSQGRSYIVVAAALSVVENEMDIFESPFQ